MVCWNLNVQLQGQRVKPCAVEMPTLVCLMNIRGGGGDWVSETVQLSDMTVKRRIQVLSVDTEKHLVVSRLKSSFAC